MATHTLASFKPLAVQLVLSASIPPPSSGKLRPPGAPLESEQLRALLQHLADPAFTSEPAHHATIGSVLTALRLTATDIQPTTLAMAQHEFLARATPLALPPPGTDAYVDLVGTGGDGKDTFNVSTTASVVAAGVDGMRVCKHGGRASSSSSGSSDLLTALGVPLMNVDAAKMSRVLASSPLAFLFAPHFHAAFAPLAPLRSSLGFPTLFNILGPLVNPARPARGVYGVHSSGLGAPYADALRLGGTKSAWVVCGQEGLDEISPAGAHRRLGGERGGRDAPRRVPVRLRAPDASARGGAQWYRAAECRRGLFPAYPGGAGAGRAAGGAGANRGRRRCRARTHPCRH